MQTETYISESEWQGKFKVSQDYHPDFGKFLAVRWLYSISATGGRIWMRILFYLLFTLTLSPLALAVDIAALAVYALLLVAKKFLEGVVAAVLAVITKAAGTVAIIAAVVVTILILYFKWDVVICFVKGLF